MANNQSLYQSMQMFLSGVQELQTSRVLSGANEAVQQIRTQEMDEAQKMQQIRGVAESLTSKLLQLGTPVNQIGAAVDTMMPKAPKTIDEALLGDSEMYRKRAEGIAQKKQDNALELAETKGYMSAMRDQARVGTKLQTDMKKDFRGALDTFRDKVAKNELKGLDELAAAPQEIEKGNLNYVLGLKQLIKRTDPRISNEDFNLAIPNTSLAAKAHRAYTMLIQNKPLPNDAEAVSAMMEVLQKRAEDRVVEKGRGYARSRAKVLGLDEKDLAESILIESLPSRFADGRMPNTPMAPQGQPSASGPSWLKPK